MMFSVIIPCYNMAQYVAETIESVKKQTYTDWECIVVDDGSTDDSRKVIKESVGEDSRFRLIHQKNKGVAAARNTAISKALGKYILPLDADDMLRPDALYRFAVVWNNTPDARLIVPAMYRYGEGVNGIRRYDYPGYERFRQGGSLANSSCYRREDWERIGGYRDGTMVEDYEFYVRLLDDNAVVVCLDHILIDYRVRKDSRWQHARKRWKEELEIIKEMKSDRYAGKRE